MVADVKQLSIRKVLLIMFSFGLFVCFTINRETIYRPQVRAWQTSNSGVRMIRVVNNPGASTRPQPSLTRSNTPLEVKIKGSGVHIPARGPKHIHAKLTLTQPTSARTYPTSESNTPHGSKSNTPQTVLALDRPLNLLRFMPNPQHADQPPSMAPPAPPKAPNNRLGTKPTTPLGVEANPLSKHISSPYSAPTPPPVPAPYDPPNPPLLPANPPRMPSNHPPSLAQPPSPPPPKPTLLIIFSYPRSGSSFFGQFFDQDPNIFYTYEPLHYGFRKKALPGIRELEVDDVKKRTVSDVMKRFMTCNMTSLSQGIVDDWVKLSVQSVSLRRLRRCIRKTQSPRKKYICSKRVDYLCKTKKLKATKLVRATMEDIQYFITNNYMADHRIKIIHFLRDPRGKINSLQSLVRAPRNIMYKKNAHMLCKRQMQDISIRKSLEILHPEMFLEIHYEDVATHPFKMADIAYNFAFSKQAPKSVMNWIARSTNSSNARYNNQPFGTRRSNSTATAFAWKTKMSRKNQQIVAGICRKLLGHLGMV